MNHMTSRKNYFFSLFIKGLFNRFSGFNAWMFLVISASLLLSSCDGNEPDDVVRIDKTTFSIEDQKAFGDNLHKVYKNTPDEFNVLSTTEFSDLYNHLEATFNILVQQTAVENRDKFDWELTILKDDSRAMAFCSPGGKFYIYSGLLKKLTGEDELVAIMAHEIHYANSGLAMEALIEKFDVVPFLLGDVFLGNEVEEAVEVAKYMRDNSYNPEAVLQGDSFAMDLVCPFQYNPTGLSKFIIRSVPENLDWIEKRKGSDNRLDLILQMESPCGNLEEDPTFSERYMDLIAVLP